MSMIRTILRSTSAALLAACVGPVPLRMETGALPVPQAVTRVTAVTPVYAALLTPQGKWLADFFIHATADALLLDFLEQTYGAAADAPLVLQDLNLHIRPGEKIGLVGRSGAGKSTIVNLLLRFYDVRSGQVLIDGQDVRQVTQDSLRAQIGMVTQDTSLLHRSVRENILYGRPDAGDEAMMAAARRVVADPAVLAAST